MTSEQAVEFVPAVERRGEVVLSVRGLTAGFDERLVIEGHPDAVDPVVDCH